MAYAKKVDNVQPLLVNAYRGLGCSVELTHRVGKDFPDAVVGIENITDLVEFKSEKTPVSAGQIEFHARWRGSQIQTIRTLEDVGYHVADMKRRAARVRG